MIFLKIFQYFHPNRSACITWHAKVSSWGKGNTSHLRAIRQTGALELLGEKSSVEGLQPFQNGLPVIGILKSTAGNAVNLVRLKACTKHIVQIKIVKFVRSYQILGFLGDFAILRGQKFRAYRSVQNVKKHFLQLFLAASVCIVADKMSHQSLGNGSVHAVHGHVVAIVGGPSKCKLGKISGTN